MSHFIFVICKNNRKSFHFLNSHKLFSFIFKSNQIKNILLLKQSEINGFLYNNIKLLNQASEPSEASLYILVPEFFFNLPNV